jgi:hypothetical protein
MTALNQSRLNKDEVLALRGLRLSCEFLDGLRRTGIYCQPPVSIQFQQDEQCYVVRGLESSGAVGRLLRISSMNGVLRSPALNRLPG